MKRTLTWSMRFAIAISAVFALAALIAGGVSYSLQSQEMTRRLETEVMADTQALVLAAQNGDLSDLSEQIAARVSVSRNGSNIVAFVPADGSAPLGNASFTTPFEGARHLAVGRALSVSGPPAENRPEGYIVYAMRVPSGWIATGRDDAWLREQGEVLVISFGWGLGLALLLSIGFAIFIARRTERRISLMEDVLDAVGTGRHALRIRDRGSDDVARLAQSVDRALDQLEAGIEAIRQVSTDVAHDLRAPLARLRLRLEPVALDADLPLAQRQEIGKALSDLDQVSETFDAILRLSRMQAGMVEITPEPIELSAMCRDIHEMMLASAEDLGHVLSLDVQGTAMIAGDRELLYQAVINLIDNAMRHCPAPAHITLGLRTTGDLVQLWVQDDGPGIPASDLDQVRERFVRLDRSRNTPGSGLGLSLVEAIAKIHTAELTFADAEPGLRVTLSFAMTRQAQEVRTNAQ
ncbi:ATP-binding protein [Thioclava sp.]|uniref:sensor histidine kinase n=1 Tax=Thioclava sp. TaxID=1933450 RepID=UPI003AA9CECD